MPKRLPQQGVNYDRVRELVEEANTNYLAWRNKHDILTVPPMCVATRLAWGRKLYVDISRELVSSERRNLNRYVLPKGDKMAGDWVIMWVRP
jgi:hypothetical protein